MSEQKMIDVTDYCNNRCKCCNEYCDKSSCPILKAPTIDPETLPIVKELREKLARYEQAEKDGRIKIIEKTGQFTCGSCANFMRFKGEKIGTCKVKKYICDRWGKEHPERGEFVVGQSHKSCKKYEEAENALKEREQQC